MIKLKFIIVWHSHLSRSIQNNKAVLNNAVFIKFIVGYHSLVQCLEKREQNVKYVSIYIYKKITPHLYIDPPLFGDLHPFDMLIISQ